MPDPERTRSRRASLVVVIPVGPGCEVEFIRDTVESVRHWAGPSRLIVLLDDSGSGMATAAAGAFDDVVVLTTRGRSGVSGGLYLTLSLGIAWAWRHVDFDVLLKLDTDALLVGAEPERDAIEHFRRHPEHGVIGSYRDCKGDRRGFAPPARVWARDLGFLRVLRRPLSRWKGWRFLRDAVRRATRDGYELAEHCQGGAYFLSREAVRRLVEHDLLGREEIRWTAVSEDQVFALFLFLAGLRPGDFATGSLPLGIRWRGLPCSPADLLKRQKKVIHSTRFFEELREPEIRAFFRERRQQCVTHGSGARP